jgi:hypothetical protein
LGKGLLLFSIAPPEPARGEGAEASPLAKQSLLFHNVIMGGDILLLVPYLLVSSES